MLYCYPSETIVILVTNISPGGSTQDWRKLTVSNDSYVVCSIKINYSSENGFYTDFQQAEND